MKAIRAPYLLITACCPCFIDSSGKRHLDPLWAKDLAIHSTYIEDLTVAVTRIEGDPPASFVPWESWPLHRIRVVDLPSLPNLWSAIRRLPRFAALIWTAVGRAHVIHSGVAGWPIPDGWVTIPVARLRRRFVIVLIESDFWRIRDGQVVSFKRRWRAAFSELMNRWCVNLAHVAFFTHENYMQTLLTRGKERGHVIQASWLDDDVICTDSEAQAQWGRKLQATAVLRLVFVGRLTPEKGIIVLLEALRSLRSTPGRVICDIVGDGMLMGQCKAIAANLKGRVDIKLLGKIEYGWPLFNLLSSYDAIAMPSLSNEQPRIVYDAFARAIPVLGFETDGLASCVKDGVTGRLCRKGSASELAELMDWGALNRPELARMGMAGLSVARSLTHRDMHERRCGVLAPMIAVYERTRERE